MFSLDSLLNQRVTSLEIDEYYNYPKEYFEKTEIQTLNQVHCKGKITITPSDRIHLSLDVDGIMELKDAISLEIVPYPFHFTIEEDLEENLINLQNSIDIMEFLWQNIVLEIPLGYTIVTDFSKYCGDGWKLVKEEELEKKNLPFANLLEKER